MSGSIEAVALQIQEFPTDQLNVSVIRQGVGDVTDTDLKIASASDIPIVVLGRL